MAYVGNIFSKYFPTVNLQTTELINKLVLSLQFATARVV